MKKGFTLIELLVVVLIIGILSAVALPKYQKAVYRAKVIRHLPLLRSISEAKKIYYLQNGVYSADLDALDIQVSYTSKYAYGTDGATTYLGTPIGQINVSATSSCVYWANTKPNVTINVCAAGTNYCYGWNAEGDKFCASLGPKLTDSSEGGFPSYEIRF